MIVPMTSFPPPKYSRKIEMCFFQQIDHVAALINTAEYDSKGRCVHHPHIRLRKKKMFGKWKTLMSACPDCCVAELRRIRMVDEKKRKMAKKKALRANKDEGGPDRGRQGGADGDAPAQPPSNGSARSIRSAPASAAVAVGAAPGLPRRSLRSSSVPPQNHLASHPPNLPFQESFVPAPVQTRVAVPRTPSKRSPSQDSYRSAPTPRRSPSQGSFQNGGGASIASSKPQRSRSQQPKALQTNPSGGSLSTASLTESDRQLSGSDGSSARSSTTPGVSGPSAKVIPLQATSLQRNQPSATQSPVTEKKTRSRSSSVSSRSCKSDNRSRPPPNAPVQKSPQLGTIHVRQMQWTDHKGNSGKYTGQVDAQFVPYGHGTMVYDESQKTKEGKWERGRFLCRSSAAENSGGEAVPRSRSMSRTAKGAGRSKSRGRSASQAGARQRSVSRQPRPVVAVFQ